MPYIYHAFGLTIQSEFELPELIPGTGDPDVSIRSGRVPDQLDHARREHFRFQSRPGRLLLKIDHIADFLVSDGREIVVQAMPSAEPESVRLFLLGSALGAILHQRGILPLHASAVRVNGECIAFCGASGSGKSTTAGVFVNRGYELIADDICAVALDAKGQPLVYPEYTQLKLWEDSLSQSGQDPAAYSRVRHVLDKFKVPAGQGGGMEPLRFRKVYVLSPGHENRIAIHPLEGMARFGAIRDNTYRKKFVDGLGQSREHFRAVSAIGKFVPVYRVERPRKPFLLEELADRLEHDFMESCQENGS